MSAVSTHVLDTTTGEPASGVVVRLERPRDGTGQAGPCELGRGVTGADGRITGLGTGPLAAGTYQLVFETGPYLAAARPAEPPFFPEVTVMFTADGNRPEYHIPLLLSPCSYTTYRGS